MKEAPIEKTTVMVKGKEIVLDPEHMKFNEVTLTNYFDREYGWIDYLGKQLEFANKELLDAEINYESLYSDRYVKAKDLGNTENYAKAQALADIDVISARKSVADRKETVGLLKAHLKAWDKNHSNAQSRGHSLRQEMKMLNQNVIYNPSEAGVIVEESTCSVEDLFK